MSHPLVVNVTKRAGKRPEWDVYVGRGACPCGERACPHGATGWGNPCAGRPLVVYVDHLATRLRHQPAFRRALAELRGKRLGCWCAPDPCHADILARLADGEDIRAIRAEYEEHARG